MTAEQPLLEGAEALRAGRWKDARAAFEAALAEEESAAALAGLGDALWWLGDVQGTISCRERAYAAFRRAGDDASAVMTAVNLCSDFKSGLGNQVAAGGWIARAERLTGQGGEDLGALRGVVWAVRAYQTTDLDLAVELAERALRMGRELRDSGLELLSLSVLGRVLVESGKVDEGMRLLDEAMAGTLGGECALEQVVHVSCQMMNACDLAADLGRAAQWSRAASGFARTHGCPFLYTECRVRYGAVLVATGEWERAEEELATGIRSAGDHYPALRSVGLASLADLRLRQGRLDEAEALLAEVGDPAATALPSAEVRLARGEPAVAAALCARRLAATGDRYVDAAPTLGLLVRAQLAAGDGDAAGSAAERLAGLASAEPDDRVAAHAALATGLVLRARGDLEPAARRTERAVEQFARLGLPLEAARARLELARALAPRAPGIAVAEARGALAALDRLGARALADEAAALLRSLGVAARGGPRGAGALTRREQEVLRLVGHGLSNPEIAARLFISRKTAAHHVSNVLAKLGLRNRAEAVAHATRLARD